MHYHHPFAKRCGPHTLGALVLFLVLCCAANPASATPNAIANGNVKAGIGNTGIGNQDSGSSSDLSLVMSATGYGAISTASANGGVAPSVSIFASATSGGDSSDRPVSSGSIDNTYYFRVVDSNPDLVGPIPISLAFDAGVDIATSGSTLYDISGSLQAWVNPGPGANLSFEYNNVYGYFAHPSWDNLSGLHVISSSVSPNNWNEIHLGLAYSPGANQCAMGGNRLGSQSAPGSITVSAFIDPTVTIDPTWLADNPDAELEFDTLQAPIAIPEPSSWILVALSAVGLALFRRASTVC